MQEFVNTVFDKQINPKYQNNRKLITFVLKKILEKGDILYSQTSFSMQECRQLGHYVLENCVKFI